MKTLITICAIVFIVAGSANAALYTDKDDWADALSAPINTINWDDVAVPTYYTTISGNQ